MNNNNAFTLAEVLITLTIIGIVAAMTIPALMNNTQNQEYVAKLKKEYSVIFSTYQSIKADNGGQIETALSQCSGPLDNACLKNVFKPKLNYVKDCDLNNGTNLNVCFPQMANIKYLNGSSIDTASYINNNTTSGLILNDGTSLAFYLDDNNCQSAISPSYKNRCGFITIDVNGLKNPNQFGKDIYVFFIFSDMIRPGASGVADYYPDCTTHGMTCASQYLYGN